MLPATGPTSHGDSGPSYSNQVHRNSLKLWMYCDDYPCKLKRITLLWDHIRKVTERNQGRLTGETREMRFAD